MVSIRSVIFAVSIFLLAWLTTVVDLVLTTHRYDAVLALAIECREDFYREQSRMRPENDRWFTLPPERKGTGL